MIAGQAPGTRVHTSGVPFTDPSGDRLREWLRVRAEQFYDPDSFSIVPMGFCFPGLDSKGGDLPPRAECASVWRSCVLSIMPQIELVLAIGGYAQGWHLGETAGTTVTDNLRVWRGGLNSVLKVIPLPHPSWRNTGWLKRNEWFAAELLPVLRKVVERCMN